MKQNYLFIITVLFNYCIGYSQDFGQFASGIRINTTLYNTSGVVPHKINSDTDAPDFDGASLGTFGANSACAQITAGEVKTWKNASANLCSVTLFWRVYLTDSPSGNFNSIPLTTVTDCNPITTLFDDELGSCGSGDQKWKEYNLNINFANGLAPDNYTLEIYYEYSGSNTSTSTCETTKYISKGGLDPNYKANFTITSPSLTCPANSIQNVDAGLCTANLVTTNPTIGDTCFITNLTWNLTGDTVASSAATGINNLGTQLFNSGLTTVTYRAEDAAGNFANCSYTVTIIDNEPPTIATLTAISVNTDAGVCTYASSQLTPPNASDNCTTVTVTPSPASLVKGLNNVTWTATDTAGLTATSTQVVTVIDNEPPTIACPLDVNASTSNDGTGNCTTTVSLETPNVFDNCTTPGNFTFMAKVDSILINPSTYLFGIGNTTVVWTATDQNGNVSMPCNQTVTVIDNENPIITAPVNVATITNTACTATGIVLGIPIATDNCSISSVTNDAPAAFPLGITIVTWTVIDGSGRFATATQTVTVTANNTIVLSSALGTDAQTRCINTPITNITYATTGATGATFSGLPTGVNGSWAANVVTITGSPFVSTSSPYNYTVTLTGGCGNLSATGTITVNTLSVSPSSITGTNTICNGDSTSLTLSGGTAGTGANAEWFTGSCGGTLAGTGSSITVSPSANTTYFVRYKGTCNTTPCASILVTVNALPTLNLVTGNYNQTVCLNTSISSIKYDVNGTVTSVNASGLPTGLIQDYKPGPKTFTISGTPSTSGTFNYTVTATGICTSTSTEGTITVRPNFTVGAINATGETICYNSNPANINSTTAASGGDGTITYKWQANGVDIVGATSATYDPPTGLTATTTYTRWAKDNTCNTTFTQSTGSQMVTVRPNFTAGPINAMGETICYNGNPANITSTTAASGGDGAITYKWQANGVDIVGATSATYDPPTGLMTTTTYTRWAKDNTCNTTFTQSTGSQMVTVRPNFTAGAINAAGETICYNGNPANIISTTAASGGDGNITYEWRANGTPIASSNTATYDPPTGLMATTTYTRWAKDNTCNTTFTQSTGSQMVTVRPNFTAGAINATGETICYNGNPANIISTTVASGGDGTITYKWQANGVDIGGATSATYVPPTGLTATTTYTRWAKDNTCNTTFTQSTGSQMVTVRPNFTAGAINATGETICYNGNPANIISTTVASGGDGTITYKWQANGVDIVGATSATYDPPTGLTATTTYTRWAKDNTCNTTFTQSTGSQMVTVRPNFTAGPINAMGETICYNGNPANITSTTAASGGDGAITYKWQANGVDIVGATSATYDPPTGLMATTTYTRWAKDNTCNTTFTQSTGSQMVTVRPNFTAGAINATGETICYNSNPANINSTTAASGGDGTITYKWQANGVDIVGATSATYDPPTGLMTTTTYTRWAKDNTCNTTFTQSTGSQMVTVRPNFTAGAINAAGETICYNGNPANIISTTAASGGDGNITYEWRANGTPIASSNTATYDPPTGLMATTTYTRWAKDNTCNTTFTQSTGSQMVTVRPNFTAGAINATGETICYNGNPANIISTTVASGGDGTITYKWQANGVDIVGATSATYDPPTGLMATTTYTRWAKDNTCNTTFTQSTGSQMVTVRPNFTAGAINATGETICYNSNPANINSTTAASGGDGTITYKWQANGVDIVGATSATYDPPTGLTATTTYTRWAKDNTCNTTFTQSTGSQMVTVRPNFTAGPINAMGETICYNGNPANITSTTAASGGDGAITYKWQANGVDIVGATSATYDPPTGLMATTTYTRWAKDNTCNTTFTQSTGSQMVTVRPNFTAGAINATGETICYNSNPANINSTTAASGGDGTITYKWQANGVDIVGATSATYDPPTGLTATTTYTRWAKDNTCNTTFTQSTGSQIVTVKPTPIATATPPSQSVCSGTLIVPINLSSSVGSTTYSWTRDNNLTATGIAASGTGNISGTLTNIANAPVTVSFTITPTANGCSGTPITGTITVETYIDGGIVTISPLPVASPFNITTICHKGSGNLSLNSSIGTIIRWESSTTAGSTWTPIANITTTHNFVNLETTTMFRAVVSNGSLLCPEVYSTPSIIYVIPNIKPSPVSAIPSTICEGDSSNLISNTVYSTSQNIQNGGLFDQANPIGWYVDGGNFNASADNGNNHTWLETNGKAGDPYDSGSLKFAIVRGALDSRLETPVFDLFGLTTANLTFNHSFILNNGAWGKVELSFDGGTTYPVTLATYSGNLSPTNKFNTPANTISINMDAYLGYPNLKIKFNFHGTENRVGGNGSNDGSSWAIDNVQIPQAPIPNLSTLWTDDLNNVISVTNATNVMVTPTKTTTYAVTSFLNGCTSVGPEGTTYITVTVNKRPTAAIGIDQLICYGGTANLTIALTGKAPWVITYSNGTKSTTVTTSANPYTFTINNVMADATYTVTDLSDANCSVALAGGLTGSATVTVLTGTPGVWTGLVSSDWFDCKNWQQGLPSSTINAVINSGLPRMPLIDPANSIYAAEYSNIASAQDIIIANGASVGMAAVGVSDLQISRDWKNSGVFAPGIGTVTFNGAAANQVQNINVGIKTNETFYNLTTNTSGTAKGISLVDNFELMVTNKVTLTNGDIRLTGEAQLVQAGTDANPSTGTGKLLRDQQGKRNSYNYNYWSSPVSTDANASYSVNSILRDGTDVTTNPFNPIAITFGNGSSFADGTLSSPIKISNSWIWSYNSKILETNTDWENYYQWNYKGSIGLFKAGEGFTMKGTGGIATIDAIQNYVFVGKPNNGTIALALPFEQTYLIGNPYPSALDANEFILDNLAGRAGVNVFNGALYFWDHFGLSNTHYLAQYQGGYATYTLIGGVAAINNSSLNLNDGAMGSNLPKQYIPVGQGFFVKAYLASALSGTTATVTGGTINFKNSQRVFKRESNPNSLFIKKRPTTKTNKDIKQKIRLGFESSIGMHRQLLVGTDPLTSTLFDIGYDAPMFEINNNDMYWKINEIPFVIQGIPDFNTDRIIPLGIVIQNAGEVTLKIDELENVSSSTNIYLHDNATGMYHDLKSSDFKITLAIGKYNQRFSLRFESQTLSTLEDNSNDGIIMFYSKNYKTLIIKNYNLESTINTVSLFNMLGQAISNWDVEDKEQSNIQIPIKNMPSGIYIAKVKTSKGESSKKIVIN